MVRIGQAARAAIDATDSTTASPQTAYKRQVIEMMRLREIFEELVDVPEPAREALFHRLGVDDMEREHLRSMLLADAGECLLDASFSDAVEKLQAREEPATRFLGTMAGSFKLEALIGEGGSALVFRGRRTAGSGTQFAAVKILPAGGFSPHAERQFQREHALLASLEHPGIARLIDGGTTADNHLYITMELVEGQPLTVHAESMALGLRERLELIESLCLAVDAAHTACVIHRDLKPSNVLVARDGRLKVLDFGIARSQDEDGGRAVTATISLTPEYAAPEQFKAGYATVAIDIFALGVILTELVSGSRVREGKLSQAISRSDGALPSGVGSRRELVRAVRGDLDAIAATATALEPRARYRSARDMAQDIRRHLTREPISARRSTRWYVFDCFVRRHWIGVACSSLLLSGLLASLAHTHWYAGQAEAEAARASAQAQRADALYNMMLELMSEAEPVSPRSGDVTVKQALERAASRVDEGMLPDARWRIEVRVALADSLGAAGEIERAVELLRSEHSEALRLLGANDPTAALATYQRARYENLVGSYESARTLVDSLAPAMTDDPGFAARLLRLSASVAGNQMDRERAVREGRAAVALSEVLGDPDEVRASLTSLGAALLGASRALEAKEVYERLLVVTRGLVGENHENTALAHSGLARAHRRLGQLERAEASSRRAIAIDRAIYPDGHWIMANHLNALTLTLIQARKLEEALASGMEGLELSRRWLTADHPELFFAVAQVGSVLMHMERYEEAAQYFESALSSRERVLGPSHYDTAVTRSSLGFAVAMSGDLQRGLSETERALADIESSGDSDPELLAKAIERHAQLLIYSKNPGTAQAAIDRLRSTIVRIPSEARRSWRGRVLGLVAQITIHSKDFAPAISLLHEAIRTIPSTDAPNQVLRADLMLMLAEIHGEKGELLIQRQWARRAEVALSKSGTPPPSLLRRLEATGSKL